MKKRMVAMAFLITACTSALFGCLGNADKAKETGSVNITADENKDPFGRYEEPVIITSVLSYTEAPAFCPPGITPEENNFDKEAKERFNIEIQRLWTAPDQQYDQKLGVALASGELPDVMVLKKPVDYQNLLENEQIMPWNDALEYASDSFKEWIYRDPRVLESVTNEKGEIMALPQYWDTKRQVNIMMIRKDWLDQVGMDVPETVEELEAVALAFKEKMGAEIGLGLNKKVLERGTSSMAALLNMFGSYPGEWTQADDGSLVPGEISPNTKIALETLNRFYNLGILPKEFALYDYSKQREEVMAENLGIIIGPFWAYDSTVGREIAKNQDSRWVTAPIPTAEGSKGAIMDVMSVAKYWVLNKDCKNPEAVVKLFNLFVDFETTYPDEAKQENGFVWNWAAVDYFDPYDIDQMHERFNEQIKTGDLSKTRDTARADIELLGNEEELWAYAEDYYKWKNGEGSYDPENRWGKYLARIDEDGAWGTIRKLVNEGKYELNRYHGIATKTMTSRRATLDKLSEETYVKMVMGETPIDKFEEYTKNWLVLGGEDIIKEVNEWYKENQ